jgi:4-hydroxy-2-oxoheptanedioate aldolase
MPRRNRLIERFNNREFALGSWAPVGEYGAIRAVGDSSADFVFLDFEHLGFSFPDLGHSLQWLMSRRTASELPVPATPLVRIPANANERNQWVIKQALDYGAFGIVQPQTTRPDDIAAIVEAMRYPQGPNGKGPNGQRGSLPTQAMRYWGVTSIPEYFDLADLYPLSSPAETLLVILVEHVEGWENIADLVRVPGVGAVLWGPGDGGVSLGIHTMDPNDPALAPYRAKVIAACKDAGVPVGHGGISDFEQAIDEGFDFGCLLQWNEVTAQKARDYAAAKVGR